MKTQMPLVQLANSSHCAAELLETHAPLSAMMVGQVPVAPAPPVPVPPPDAATLHVPFEHKLTTPSQDAPGAPKVYFAHLFEV